MTLQHIVLFSFPDQLSAEDDADMRAQVASWPAQIGGMSKLRLGRDLTGERTRGYSRLLYMEFPGVADLAEYQQHPVHQHFHRWVMDRACTPLAFDYFLDEDTVLIPEDCRGADGPANEAAERPQIPVVASSPSSAAERRPSSEADRRQRSEAHRRHSE